MSGLTFFTVDVFTTTKFGGNPLAVVMGGQDLEDAAMQSVAAEFNLSETTFVLPPSDPANTARIRIFNRTAEMAFAGHPMVGTGFVLALQQPELSQANFEIPAGIVRVNIQRGDDGNPIATTIDVPRPLSTGASMAPKAIAAMLGLTAEHVVTANHSPVVASNGTPFIYAELTSEGLSRCEPNIDAFRLAMASLSQMDRNLGLHVYCRTKHSISARMFAPLTGTWEDPATGSANATLGCLLLSLDVEKKEASFVIRQGIEMGRPSELQVAVRRTRDGILATLCGSCVAVMQGHITV